VAKEVTVYAQPRGTRRTIPCQICGRGFDDHEVLEAAKRFDAAKVSPIPGVPHDEAVKALFAAKTDATQQRLRSEKRKNATILTPQRNRRLKMRRSRQD